MAHDELIDFDLLINEFDEMIYRRRCTGVFRNTKFDFVNTSRTKKFILKPREIILNRGKRYRIYSAIINFEFINYCNNIKNKAKREDKFKLLQFIPNDNTDCLNSIITICSEFKDSINIKKFQYIINKSGDIRIIYLVSNEYAKIFEDVLSIGIKCKKLNAILRLWTQSVDNKNILKKLSNILADLQENITEIDDIKLSILTFMNLDYNENVTHELFHERLISYVEDGKMAGYLPNISNELIKSFQSLSLYVDCSSRSFKALARINAANSKPPVPFNSIQTYIAYKALLLMEKYNSSKKFVKKDMYRLVAVIERWLFGTGDSLETLAGREWKANAPIKRSAEEVLNWRSSFTGSDGPTLLKHVIERENSVDS